MTLDHLIFGFIYFYTVSRLLKKQKKQPVIIGVPDIESKRVIWITKPAKTKWDEFKEGLPYAFWGMVVGSLGTMIIIGAIS